MCSPLYNLNSRSIHQHKEHRTMKFQLFGVTPEPATPPVLVKLSQRDNGDLQVIEVNEEGKCRGHLLAITPDGEVTLLNKYNSKSAFKATGGVAMADATYAD